MSNARRYRRMVKPPADVHAGWMYEQMSTCPHCGSRTELLATQQEWNKVTKAHGVGVRPFVLPSGDLIKGWWFCHHCDQGGALVWQPRESASSKA